jgi:hypothetical protein
MKKITRYIVPVVLACLGLQGCSNLLSKITDTGTDTSSSGTVPVTICVAGEDSVSSSCRTILPDAASSIAGYELYCGTSGAAQSSLKKFTTLNNDSVVNLASGTWDFTLYAETKNDAGEYVRILSGEQNNVTLEAGPVSLSFTLEPLTTGTGTGTIKITITWPDSAGVAKIIPTFDNDKESDLTLTDDDGDSSSAVYTKSAVSAGGYSISFSLKDSNSKEIASIPEYVRVYGNLESTATFDLKAADFNSAPAAPSDLAAVVSGGTNDDTADVTLTWKDNSTNEKKFEAAYWDDDGKTWKTSSLDPAVITTTFSGLTRGKSYTFRILAENGFGDSDPDTVTQSVPFKAPASLSPADKAATAATDPALSWDAVTNADHYEVQLATSEDGVSDADIQSTTVGKGSTETSFTPSSYSGGWFWYWRVRAVDSNGENGTWSNIQKITVKWGTLSVTINGPGTGTSGSTEPSTTTDDTPEFTWNAVNGATKYELYISTSDDIGKAEAIELTTNSYTPDEEAEVLDNNTTYYWRVAAVTTDALNSNAETTSAYSTALHFTVAWKSDGADGDGPADNIRYIKELKYIAANTGYLNGHYKLGTDIDLSSVTSWTPIGAESNPFTGSFDGNEKTISGLTISSPSSGYQGLFGYASGAVFTNVVLTGVSITGGSYNNIGALSGYCKNGSVTKCSSKGTINAGGQVGGLIGAYRSDSVPVTISSCYSSCNITCTGYEIGGLLGLIQGVSSDDDVTVSDSYADGTVSGTYSVGGLIGRIWDYVEVSNCHATGDVTGTRWYDDYGSGGLIGTLYGYKKSSNSEPSCVVEKCYATGSVTGTYDVGGLVGSNGYNSSYYYPGKITCCYATGAVTGTKAYIGGLVGNNNVYSTIDNSFATGTVSGTASYGGGCIGYTARYGSVVNCYSIGTVSATGSNIGGFLGSNSNATVTSCFYDRENSGMTDTGKGTGEPAAEMKNEATFINATDGGWDFIGETENGSDDIWNIDTYRDINNGYPYLSALPPQ